MITPPSKSEIAALTVNPTSLADAVHECVDIAKDALLGNDFCEHTACLVALTRMYGLLDDALRKHDGK